MIYKIETNDAQLLRNEIVECIKQGKDEFEREIDTWKIEIVNKNRDVLVHNTDQWKEKGNLHLDIDEQDNSKIICVTFHYWKKCPKEERSKDDEKYILGRFTELILVHFGNQVNSIEISNS